MSRPKPQITTLYSGLIAEQRLRQRAVEGLRGLVVAGVARRHREPVRLQRPRDRSPNPASAPRHQCNTRHGSLLHRASSALPGTSLRLTRVPPDRFSRGTPDQPWDVASTAVSAVMLTMPRTVVVGVRMCTDLGHMQERVNLV